MRDRIGGAWTSARLLELLSWRELLVLAAVGTLVVVAAVIAGVLFLLLFPVVLAAVGLVRWHARRRERKCARRARERLASRPVRVVVVDPDAVQILPPRR